MRIQYKPIMEKESSFFIKFYLGFFGFYYSILDLLSLVMEEGKQIKSKKLMQAVGKAFKVATDSRFWSISVPLLKEIVHLTQDLFTSILQSITYDDLDNLTVISIVCDQGSFYQASQMKAFLKKYFSK